MNRHTTLPATTVEELLAMIRLPKGGGFFWDGSDVETYTQHIDPGLITQYQAMVAADSPDLGVVEDKLRKALTSAIRAQSASGGVMVPGTLIHEIRTNVAAHQRIIGAKTKREYIRRLRELLRAKIQNPESWLPATATDQDRLELARFDEWLHGSGSHFDRLRDCWLRSIPTMANRFNELS